jgi:hypothetical protein
MDLIIEFNQAAFTHHIAKEDIRFAISTAQYDAAIDEDASDNKHLIIGFDRNAKRSKLCIMLLMKIPSMFFMQ